MDNLKAFEALKLKGIVRLHYQEDEACLEDLMGDTFNAKVNSDIPLDVLEREAGEFIRKVEAQGVFGLIGQYRFNEEEDWIDGPSVWGLVGTDHKEIEEDIAYQTIEHVFLFTSSVLSFLSEILKT